MPTLEYLVLTIFYKLSMLVIKDDAIDNSLTCRACSRCISTSKIFRYVKIYRLTHLQNPKNVNFCTLRDVYFET